MNTSMHSSLCLGTKSVLSSLALCLGLTQLAHADSLLVGTDLTGNPGQGGVLCAYGSGCNVRAQQFTLYQPVEVSQIQILVSGPLRNDAPRPFSTPITLAIGSQFPVSFGQTFWTGTETFADPDTDPQSNAITELLSYDGVNTILGAGTYYLQVNGGDAAWGALGSNVRLATTAGALGLAYSCDPSSNCAPGRVDQSDSRFVGAVDINGTVLTPEPSSLVLSMTGLAGLGVLGWSKAVQS